MVEYENRQPAEDINAPESHPLNTFAIYGASALILVVLLVVLMQFAGGFLAKRVPFSVEMRLVESIGVELGDSTASLEMVAYLNELAERLLPYMEVPEGMSVLIHYDKQEVFNAFATLGGNLLFYRGLLQVLPHENALAMVMAHEIAHVVHRDPAAGLGGGAASALVLAGLTGNAGTGPAAGVLSRAGLVTGMQFTRRMEVAADTAAVVAVGGLYGHTEGAAALFRVIAAQRPDADEEDSEDTPSVFERFATTHPLDDDRIAAIDTTARGLGLPTSGATTPLPEAFQEWLKADD